MPASKRPRQHQRRPAAKPSPDPRGERIRKHWPAFCALVLIALGSIRIVSTYSVFNHTVDEPAHVACGMEWLDRGAYRMEDQHPPLARVLAALGPYLAGVRSQGQWDANPTPSGMYLEGQHIFFANDEYDRNLALARLGILPCFWIACIAVYVWARRTFDPPTAVAAVFLFSWLPPVLAHAGLATTDMALTAFVGAAFVSMLAWCERPTVQNSILFGAMTALALLSKFSSLLFLPAAALAVLIAWFDARRPEIPRLIQLLKLRSLPLVVALSVAVVLIWAGYRFHAGPLFSGIKSVYEHNRNGHPSYLMGQRGIRGWWYYFPVVLAVKTPLPFIAFSTYGAAVTIRRNSFPFIFALAILIVGMLSDINIGVRHILPVYLGLSIVAAAGAIHLYRSGPGGRLLAAALILWLALTSALAHPDYLPYFNGLAGDQPERIVADSDLDWGQDMKRLAQRLRERNISKVTFRPLIFDDLQKRGFPPVDFGSPAAPSPGWNAVSITVWKVLRMGAPNPASPPWPDLVRQRPVERVGKSVLLYYFPPENFTPWGAPYRIQP